MIGIIGAMDEEVAKVKEEMTDVTITTAAGMDFYEGKVKRQGRSGGALRHRQGECGDVQPDPGRPFRRQCDY